jgi:hypothetical protein
MVTVTENGKRRQVTKREAVIALLVNESASAELRATKMLIDILRDIEKRAGSTVIPAKAAVREIGWISAVRSSRQPLRGFLGMRNSVNAINDFPHAEEPPFETGTAAAPHDEGARLEARNDADAALAQRSAANSFTRSKAEIHLHQRLMDFDSYPPLSRRFRAGTAGMTMFDVREHLSAFR